MSAIGTTKHLELVAHAEEFGRRCDGRDTEAVVAAAIAEFSGKIAVLSSFGVEAAALIHIVSRVDPSVPVIFLDTLRHFPETLAYKERLTRVLGLRNVIDMQPDSARLAADDPNLTLAVRNPDMCCYIRKTLPMVRALRGFDAYFTGRKRFQSPGRAVLPLCEVQDRWIKVNPLTAMTRDDIDSYFRRFNLPRHPLESGGYLSIGCLPCTQPASDPADIRSGRWSGTDKTECGIHLGEDGRMSKAIRFE
jgi:phosphoadenosine phosphosulfate reductase